MTAFRLKKRSEKMLYFVKLTPKLPENFMRKPWHERKEVLSFTLAYAILITYNYTGKQIA